MLSQKQVIQAKIEAEKGTAESMGFTDILCYEPKIDDTSPFDKRPAPGQFLGPAVAGVILEKTGVFTGGVELRGNASGGCDAGLAILLQCCGLAKTDEVYQVTSTEANHKTCTMFGFIDGMEKLIYGVMGNVTFEGEVGKKIMCNYDMPGIWSPPTDVDLPTPSYGTAKPLIFAGGTFKIATVAKKISKFTLNMGNIVILRSDANAAGGIAHAMITNFEPIFSCDLESELVATDDHYGKKLAGTEVSIEIMAKSATDKATFAIPKFQYTGIGQGDREGQATFDITGQCNKDSGDDNVSITFAAA